jgi:hypothetical protein
MHDRIKANARFARAVPGDAKSFTQSGEDYGSSVM